MARLVRNELGGGGDSDTGEIVWFGGVFLMWVPRMNLETLSRQADVNLQVTCGEGCRMCHKTCLTFKMPDVTIGNYKKRR